MKSLIHSLTMREAGRKFRAFLICIIAATTALVIATQVPVLVTILPAYLTALGGFLTVYLTGNIAHHHVSLMNGRNPQGEIVLPPEILREDKETDS